MSISAAFWKDKRVFLTGHTGFKGAWLTLMLRRMGADVSGYSLADDQSELYKALGVDGEIRSLGGDIRDYAHLHNALREAAPDVVIHMAAQALVRLSYDEPVETYAANVMGTVHLLEAMRHVPGIRAGVIVTTDKCYENKEWERGYREDDHLGGYDPYSSSKACAELVTQSYRQSFFSAEGAVLIASARSGNVIGGGDWSRDRILPDMITAFAEGEPIELRSSNAIRPWQHVLDPLKGYLMLAQGLYEGRSDYAGAWNFGPDEADARTVRELVTQGAVLWGGGIEIREVNADKYETSCLKLDSTKARSKLGWQPQMVFDTAVAATVDWYARTHRGQETPRAMCEKQIDAYLRG